MWYKLRRFESVLFLPLFLVYASLRHIPYFTRCTKCGKRLFDYYSCMRGLCESCDSEGGVSGPIAASEELYDSLVPEVNPSLEHIYKRVAKRVGRGRILEVGCGKGLLLSRLDSPHRELYGFDILKWAVKRSKTQAENAHLCVGDARNMPFKSDSFDYVIGTEVLEHIVGNNAVRECYRVLKPSGVALFTVPNMQKRGHPRVFTYKSFVSFVQQAGFEIVCGRKFGLYIPFITHSSDVLSFAIGKHLPLCAPLNVSVSEFLATNFFIECRKPATKG